MLDDVAAVDDSRRSLPHDLLGAADDLLLGGPAAATDEHGAPAGGLHDPPVVRQVVRRVCLDHVRAQLDRLADERDDRLDVAVHAVAAASRLHGERLDHERHPDDVAGGPQSRDVADASTQELGLAREE
jgi:hypothetical protein